MDSVLELIRPEPVKVSIYGTEYPIRRIRYPAMLKIIGMISKILTAGGIAEVLRSKQRLELTEVLDALAGRAEDISALCTLVIQESLPEFKDSEELAMEDMLVLFQKLWSVNKLDQALERFFAQTGMNPQQPQ